MRVRRGVPQDDEAETPVPEPVSVYKAKPRFRKGVLDETPLPELKQPRRRFKRDVLTDAQETSVPEPVSVKKAKPRFKKGSSG